MFGNVFHAPLDKPRRILDIGCGTGRNTVKLSLKYPDAQVIGVDLLAVAPIHPRPDKVEYIQGDFRELVKSGDSRFQAGTFDYVYFRLLVLGMTDWPGFIGEVIRLLAPSGWVEGHEMEIVVRDASGDEVTGALTMKAFEQLTSLKSFDVLVGRHLPRLMEAVGLKDIRERTYKFPFFVMPDAPESEVCGPLLAP